MWHWSALSTGWRTWLWRTLMLQTLHVWPCSVPPRVDDPAAWPDPGASPATPPSGMVSVYLWVMRRASEGSLRSLVSRLDSVHGPMGDAALAQSSTDEVVANMHILVHPQHCDSLLRSKIPPWQHPACNAPGAGQSVRTAVDWGVGTPLQTAAATVAHWCRRISAWAMRALAHFWQIGRLESPPSPGPAVLKLLLLWLCSYRCC